jgi:Skp family chaperone for outer membrane proteins
MKKTITILTLLLVAVFALPVAANSIAWFNPQKVLKNSKAGKRVLAKQETLKKKFARKRMKLETPLANEKKSIEKEWKTYQANQSVLNGKERKRRLAKLKKKYDGWMEKVKKLQVKLNKIQGDLAKEFQNVAAPFSKKLKSAAAKVATSGGYSFIIAHDPNNPQILLYAKPSLDVTNKLIAHLGR